MEGYRYEMMDEKSAKPILESEDQIGVIPRCVLSLFNELKNAETANQRKYQVTAVLTCRSIALICRFIRRRSTTY